MPAIVSKVAAPGQEALSQYPEALLYEPVAGKPGKVRCNMCQWRCTISAGGYGVCRTRYNDGSKLYALNYGEVSALHIDPIEKKPLAHFYPATKVLSLGGWGCNFHCIHCQNWQISFTAPLEGHPASRKLSPEQVIAICKQSGCAGIAWTYNDPSIWLEYTLATAKLAKAAGLYTVYVTNGYATPEHLDMIAPYLDCWRVDVKGFSDKFYKELAKIARWRDVLDVAVLAQRKGLHVEVITNVIPTLNDDAEQLRATAEWVRDALGLQTPWHVTGFHPDNELLNLPPTPVETLEMGVRIGRQVGLRFVYIGNVPGHRDENTFCYRCGKLVVDRQGYRTQVLGLNGSRCKYCDADLNFRGAPQGEGRYSDGRIISLA